MAKLTIDNMEAASRPATKASTVEDMVEDARGRSIGVRKLKVLERINMLKLIGSGNSDNLLYVSSVTPAFLVTRIDEDHIGKPTTQLQLDALLQRLDDDGLEAVTGWMAENYKELSAEEQKAELKNG